MTSDADNHAAPNRVAAADLAPLRESRARTAAMRGRPARMLRSDDATIALLALGELGSPVHPDHQSIEIDLLDHSTDSAIESIPKAIADLRSDSDDRRPLVLCWDAMDAKGLRTLEKCGFRPAAQPYFHRGGNAVEFVMGYTDPTGSILELVLD